MRLPRTPYPLRETLATLRRMFAGAPPGEARAQTLDLAPGVEPDLWLGFVGDVMPLMGRAARFAPEVGAFFAGCARIAGNLEGIVTGERWVPFLQRHSADVFAALAAVAPAERWVLGVANNHAPDYGDAGLDATVRAIAEAGMTAVGTVEHPRVELAPGVQLTAWTEWTNGFTARVPTRDPGPGPRSGPGTDPGPSGDGQLQIAFPHWGYEFERTPRPGARAALPAGYDVVVGHHSHVPQAVELVDGRLVAWSLGNFCTDVPLAAMGEGALLKLGIATGAGGPPRVVVARTVPLRIDRSEARACAVAVAA